MSETVTSQNIVGIIRIATAGKSKTIQNLNRLVWSRFYAVCDSIETNPTFRQMAFDYANTQKLSKKRLAKLRRFLRESSGESIPDPDLEDLAQQITIILQEQTQDTSFDVKSLLSLFRTFSLKFAEFYAHPDDAEDNS